MQWGSKKILMIRRYLRIKIQIFPILMKLFIVHVVEFHCKTAPFESDPHSCLTLLSRAMGTSKK